MYEDEGTDHRITERFIASHQVGLNTRFIHEVTFTLTSTIDHFNRCVGSALFVGSFRKTSAIVFQRLRNMYYRSRYDLVMTNIRLTVFH